MLACPLVRLSVGECLRQGTREHAIECIINKNIMQTLFMACARAVRARASVRISRVRVRV